MKKININFWRPRPKPMSDNDPRWGPLEFILKMPSVCWLALIILAWFAVVGRGCIRYSP